MATVNKDFRIKNGLVVEGSTATVNGSNVLTEASTEFLQDTAAALFDGSQNGISFDYNDTTGKITATVSTTPTFADKILFEGATADDYETTLQVVDPTADRTITLPDATTTLVGRDTTDTLTNKTINVDNNTVSGVAASSFVLSDASGNIDGSASQKAIPSGTVVGTSDTQTLTNKTIALGSNTVSGTLAEFNTAVTDADFASLAGSETLTNKTISVDNNTVSGVAASSFVLSDSSGNIDGSASQKAIPTGTVVGSSDTQTLTNKTISGSDNTLSNIGNGSLTNSSVTINGASVSLGGSATLYTDDISEDGSPTNKWFTDERAQDAVAQAFANGSHTNITVSYDDSANAISLTGAVTYTDENAQDAVGNAVGNGLDYDDNTGAISVDPSEFALSAVGAPTGNVSLATYKITNLGTPTDDADAATKAYVDAATAGLNVHDSVQAATTANLNISSDLENGDSLDGVTLATGNRVLVKNQTTKTQNGIYVVQSSGAAVRATDYDTAGEVDAGDFVFVEAGTVNGKTGWVQTNKITTIGSDNIEFTQFSGAGTYLAGNGLSLTGNTFAIDTATTVDKTTAQTLTNKTISGNDNTITNIGNSSLTNSSITINGSSVSLGGTRTLGTDDISEGSTNKYFTTERAEDAASTMITSATHSGISVTYTDNGSSAGTLAFTNDGVTSLTGTANQVSVSGSTGSVTLSLPQSIATTSSPTFNGVTVGSVTLTDALLGTATQALTDGTATVVDSWSTASYSGAKYLVQMKKNNDIEIIEVLVAVDGNNNVYLTEYADVISNAQLGTTDADYSSGNVRLLVTASNGTTVKVQKTLIEA